MHTGIYHTHKLVVILFLMVYLVKLILLFTRKEKLDKFSKAIKIPEMIISFLFLATGIYLITNTSGVSTLLMVKIILVVASIPLAVIGFKKHKKALALLSVFFLIGSYGLAEINRGSKAKKVVIASTVITDVNNPEYELKTHGQALFLAQCAMCHGESGTLKVEGAKDLTASKLSEPEIQEILMKGKNSMPKYKNTFSTDEIKAITAFVMSLRN